MKFGARNQVTGKITRIKKGSVMCQVELDVAAPHALTSVMTVDSADDLGLKKGDKVRVIVKAIHVLLAKD